ncbi:hypothetical protein DPO80_16300 [Salmonella enterica subsp. salamae]|nr:hypothetical protein [Salmonella enterica subsp. salamae]
MNTQNVNVKTATKESSERWVKNSELPSPGIAYCAGMKWRGVVLKRTEAESLNQFDRDIAKARSPEARSWLLQNKACFMALILDIETINVG